MCYRLIADYAKCKSVWLFWPHNPIDWVNDAVPAQKAFARLAMTVSMVAPVFVAVPVRDIDRAHFILPKHINIVPLDIKGTAIRYSEVMAVQYNGTLSLLGNHFDHDQHLFADACVLPTRTTDLKLDSRMISVDNLGNALVHMRLFRDLNPKVRDPISLLHDLFNLKTIVPLNLENITSIGDVCTFIDDKTVLLSMTKSDDVVRARITTEVEKNLMSAVASDGGSLAIRHVIAPEDNPFKFAAYSNVLVCNERVIAPLFAPKSDNEALAQLQCMFVHKEVCGVEIGDLLKGGEDIRSLIFPVYR